MFRREALQRLALPLVLGCLALVYGTGIPKINAQFAEGAVGPRSMPTLLVVIALASVAVICIQEVRAALGAARDAATPDRAPASGALKPLLLFAAILGSILAFKPAGALASIFVLSVAILWLFDYATGAPVKRAIAAVAITAACFALFSLAFGARLPLLPEGW